MPQRLIKIALVLVSIVTAACSVPHTAEWQVTVEDRPTDVEALLIGISAPTSSAFWVAGTGGTYGRSSNAGRTWTFGTVPGADSLQFRDVHAVDSVTAYLLSIGPGEQSRIYRTDSAGDAWHLQWTNPSSEGFFDCFDFWTPDDGLAIGDAVDGRIMVARTTDGRNWSLIDPSTIPPGTEGEGAFAASGTCLVAAADSAVWIGTGSRVGSKVYRSLNRGETWEVVEAPIVTAPEAAGITSIAMLDAVEGFAAGAALSSPDDPDATFAATTDGGLTWELRGTPQLPNVYGLAARRIGTATVILAVGPKGMDVSYDGGSNWESVDKRNYWSVQFTGDSEALAVGPGGRISRIGIDRVRGG